MTYGGIFPIAVVADNTFCYHCGKGQPDHFAESMGDFFHGSCVAEFLKTPRGLGFIAEGYPVYINKAGKLLKLT